MIGSTLRPRPPKEKPLPYTSSPWKLLREDIQLVFRNFWALPRLLLPLKVRNGDNLNELYPSLTNIGNLAFQAVISSVQILFLISIPNCFVWMVPFPLVAIYVVWFLWANKEVCDAVLNGERALLVSNYPPQQPLEHMKEHWIFINGIACGQTWLQMNLDRLGYTFNRKVTGLHNPSTGLVFDVIQCLIQRCFSYPTQDVRDAYALVRASLTENEFEKVVLIVHSQGGIEAGLIADWLYDELPQQDLRKLEIYTFGNAANHFNNPVRTFASKEPGEKDHSPIIYIEHFVNSGDFVGLWGVLNFAQLPNRFAGKVFVHQGSGHLFNQHYLATMFPLGPDRRVLDTSPFIETIVDNPDIFEDGAIVDNEVQGDIQPRLKIRRLSRLWQYRNGGSPREPHFMVRDYPL
ncbi:hypothetical protein BDW69DRAFT_193694 [Aspergillus filifer]